MRIVVDTDGQKREVRIIGDKIYERDFQIDEWQLNEGHLAQATQASVQRLAEEAQPKSIAERLKELEAIKELPGEIIDGISCVHYRGKIDSLKGLREQLANESDPLSKVALQEMLKTQEQMEITIMVEFWIGEHGYLVHKQQRVQSWKDRGMTIIATSTIQFSNFNKLVEIEPPL